MDKGFGLDQRMEVAMRTIALILPLLIVPQLAGAQGTEPDRYRLEKTPDGYVRMDTRTGEMSICREKSGELVCKGATEERTDLRDEIDRLRTDMKALDERLSSVKALEDRVAKLEGSLAARIENSLPTEEDFNKTMSYMERFFRSFMAIVKDFEGQEPKPAEPGPDRT